MNNLFSLSPRTNEAFKTHLYGIFNKVYFFGIRKHNLVHTMGLKSKAKFAIVTSNIWGEYTSRITEMKAFGILVLKRNSYAK